MKVQQEVAVVLPQWHRSTYCFEPMKEEAVAVEEEALHLGKIHAMHSSQPALLAKALSMVSAVPLAVVVERQATLVVRVQSFC